MRHDRVPPRDGERIDNNSCPDCFHLKEECVCDVKLTNTPHTAGLERVDELLKLAAGLADALEKAIWRMDRLEDAGTGEHSPAYNNAVAKLAEWKKAQ